jgi:signal peptidase II
MESKAEPNPPGGPDVSAPLLSVGSPDAAPLPQAGDAPPASLEAAEPPILPAPVPAHEVPPARPPSVLLLTVVTVLSLAADLVTKWWAKANLSGYDPVLKSVRRVTVIKDHVDFIFAQNPGGAWSLFRSMPDTLRRPFFLVVSAIAIVFIVSIYRHIHPDQRGMKWGLPLALGGAMGNLVDRIRYGWVIDFVDVYLTRGARQHHWPTFNVADVAIVVGVGLMAISMLSTARGPGHVDALAAPPSA